MGENRSSDYHVAVLACVGFSLVGSEARGLPGVSRFGVIPRMLRAVQPSWLCAVPWQFDSAIWGIDPVSVSQSVRTAR